MRVLFVSDVYFPRVNGVSTSIRTFRADLAAQGIDTCLLAPDYGEAAAAAADGDSTGRADVLRVASARVPRDPEDRRMRPGALRRMLQSLEREHFDLVHVHTPFVAHYAGLKFARRIGVPCIATYHTFFEEYLHHYVPALPRGVGRWFARAFTRSQCRALDALIAPSEAMRAALSAYGVTTPVHVVPTGLPTDRFKQGDGARFRREHGIARERPLLLYVGRVAYEKNIEFLVRMFARVLERLPAALLMIAGEGPARAAIGTLVSELGINGSVRFTGYLERNTGLLDCYSAANVFVFASRTETQGLVLLEAMAQGTPVVSTAALGTTSILAAARGALVAPEDQAQFAAAVAELLLDPQRQRRLAIEARHYATTWASPLMAQRMASVYAQVGPNCGYSSRAARSFVSDLRSRP